MSRKICFACGLEDESVEAGGLYHCPNPLCTGCGATYWKRENLDCKKTLDGIEISSKKEWITKALEVINEMPYKLGNKIITLKKTQELLADYENRTT